MPFSSNRRRVSSRPRRMSGRQVTTRSGRVLKVNSSVSGRWSEHKEAKARRKVDRMRGLPKSRLKRLAWRLNPRRLAEYWFSRDGAIMALKIIGIAIFIFFVLTIGTFAFFRRDLQAMDDLANANLGGSLAFYDRTGKVYLGSDYDKVKRVPVASKDISQHLKDATVAVEDRDFYSHGGFDVRGIVRAGLNDVIHHGQVQGGSTITQQLVKLSSGWTEQRTVGKKIRELILAVQLERTLSKDEILRRYLNLAPYGSLDYGAQVAAKDYFHTDASDLTIAQAAFLASIPKSPGIYSPYNKLYFDKEALLNRYNYVLDVMQQTGKITKAEADKAKKTNILGQIHKQPSKFAGILAPYFMQSAENQIVNMFSLNSPNKANKTQAWKIITTLDYDMQKLTEGKIRANRGNLLAHGADETASVVEDVQTGQYLALVGGLNFQDNQINFAQWPISPGSSFKPYDYSTLIDNHTDAGAGSVLYDTVGPVPGYACTNKALPPRGNCLFDFDRRSVGPMTLRYALGGSRNIPAVKTMASVFPGDPQGSVNKTVQTSERLMNNAASYACYKDQANVTLQRKEDRKDCFTSAAIGDGAFLHLDHHTNGLASLGRMGLSIPATYILRVEDSNGKSLYKWKQPKKGDVGVDQVVRPETAYIVNNILSDPNASYFGFGTKFQSYNNWRIAVKTGTTNNSFDGLMMAYTTKYAVGTWVGYHTRQRALFGPMENITMPVTRGIITSALDKAGKPVNWTEPAGIQHLPAFRSRYAYSSQTGAPTTDIYPSWYKQPGNTSANAQIDKVSGLLATSCTPPLAKQTQPGGSTANHFSIDIFYGTKAVQTNGRTGATDNVHNCGDSKPTVQITITQEGSSKYNISATGFAGTHPLNDSKYPQFPGTINISVSGTGKTCTKVSDGVPCTFTYRPTTSGTQKVSATITDSVLYQGSDSTSYSFHGSGSGFTFKSAHDDGSQTTVKWSGGTGSYTVTGIGGTLCTAGSGQTSCHGSKAKAPGGTNVTIQDGSGSTTSGSVN